MQGHAESGLDSRETEAENAATRAGDSSFCSHYQGFPGGEKRDPPDKIPASTAPDLRSTRRGRLAKRFPGLANAPLAESRVCQYENSPDHQFILDRHPLHPQVLIASPCSGHGFKFSPVIGEIAALLLEDKRPAFDLSLFNIGRLI